MTPTLEHGLADAGSNPAAAVYGIQCLSSNRKDTPPAFLQSQEQIMAKARTGTQPGAGGKSSHRGGKARTVTQHGVGAKRTKAFGKLAKANPQLSKVNRKGFSWR